MKIKYYLLVLIVLVSFFVFNTSVTKAHDESLHTEPVSIWHNFLTAFGFGDLYTENQTVAVTNAPIVSGIRKDVTTI